ncbi:glycoside hydrolase family 15 protein [Microbacterium sp. cx-59]|uniref:glycoside hydrolase family 15 protein n=1 Tax=Microbacterium sp. cx-59 TaxID=2891207 RepID=UPI001E607885|nr:glycoside hydrolase family 15 protein [Microbacterium sp. cx-59]MCC4909526.1 glycoside hydrolase family 15 protein [Microbacterium sp. cx-59]
MSAPIEDYALLSNCRTAALVSREGSVDWFCAPRFDSASVFGALLGEAEQGCWRLRPHDEAARATRRYDGDTFVLITRWETPSGVAEVHDLLPVDGGRVDLVRRVVGVSGEVEFTTHLRIRFDYARALPWVRQMGDLTAPALHATAGPDALVVRGVALAPHGHAHRGRLTVAAGETRDLTATWFPSYAPTPEPLDVDAALAETRDWWTQWAASIAHDGPHRDEVVRSLLVLRALSHQDTGGIVAAVTTSLPEQFGGARNWDYRYVWLRDAALTLEALVNHGFLDVAESWRLWLLRAVAGDPAEMQIMYGIAGERDLAERELTSLPGYQGAAPVRVGNGAVDQYQADVVGEVMVALEAARVAGLPDEPFSWALQRALLDGVAANLDRPDNGIWEIRGEPRLFTQSRVMMWAAFDRGVRAVEEHGLDGPVDRWRMLRDHLRDEILARGVDATGGYFTQHYDSHEVDASLLVLPQVGFCAPDDPRMLATVAEIERQLMGTGLVDRYRTASGVDGLAGTEHPFLACSFWLVEQYASSGRVADAEKLMDLACLAHNDVGLLSEEFDPVAGRQVGNTPQAFSHLALVRAADALHGHSGRAAHRR